MAAFAGGIMIASEAACSRPSTSRSSTSATTSPRRRPGAQRAQQRRLLALEIGLVVFAFSIGLAIIATAALPKWLAG